jgi:hypothetical protein
MSSVSMLTFLHAGDCLTTNSLLRLSTQVKVIVKVTLRLAVYRQLVCLGTKLLETHDHIHFFQLNPCGHGPYAKKMGLSLTNMLGIS